MTEADPKNLRSRFYLSEIARWLLVVFFFLVLTIYYFSSEPDDITPETFDWLIRFRDITLGAGIILLALGNFLRLSGSPLHRKLRWFWMILAIVFTIFWIFKGSSYVYTQLA